MGVILRDTTASSDGKLPEPEDVFLAWLLAQSTHGDLHEAARTEIARLGRYKGTHDGPKRLAAIFEAFCDSLGTSRLQ